MGNEEEKGIIKNTIADASAIMTGILTSSPKQLMKSAGALLQTVRINKKSAIFKSILKEYHEQGRIKPDYLASDQGLTNLGLLIEAIDNKKIDETRFKAMQALFIGAATEEMSSRDEPIVVELMKILEGLDGGDILILATAYKLRERPRNPNLYPTAYDWLTAIANNSGLKSRELVELHETQLIEKNCFHQDKW